MEALKLYQKLIDFSDWLFPAVDQFPRHEKFALCTQIKNCVYGMVRETIRFQKSKDKLRRLFDIDIELDMLRFLIRHAHQRRYLSNRRYQYAAALVAEIGKIVGGLFRAFRDHGARP